MSENGEFNLVKKRLYFHHIKLERSFASLYFDLIKLEPSFTSPFMTNLNWSEASLQFNE